MSANFTPNQNEYKNLTPFKCWLLNQINTWGLNNFPFVESDFDELTNYAMMMKLMKALNDVISNENLVEQDMTNLFHAFTELQQYIENYFDFELQEKVDNKLDEMVKDGSLEEIISKYISDNFIYTIETCDELKESSFSNNQIIKSLGYHSIGDGGQGLYLITETEPSTYYETLESGLFAKLLNNEINIKQFGAYGDGVHDDSQSFINAITYLKNKALYIPCLNINAGTYQISETIDVPIYVKIISMGSVRINYTGNTNLFHFYNDKDISSGLGNNGFNLGSCLDGTNGSIILYGNNKTGTAIRMGENTMGTLHKTGSSWCVFKNIYIDNFENGLFFTNIQNYIQRWENIVISNCGKGITNSNQAPSNSGELITFNMCGIHNNDVAVEINNVINFNFVNTSIDYNKDGIILNYGGYYEMNLSNCWLESNNQIANSYLIKSLATQNVLTTINVNNCYIYPTSRKPQTQFVGKMFLNINNCTLQCNRYTQGNDATGEFMCDSDVVVNSYNGYNVTDNQMIISPNKYINENWNMSSGNVGDTSIDGFTFVSGVGSSSVAVSDARYYTSNKSLQVSKNGTYKAIKVNKFDVSKYEHIIGDALIYLPNNNGGSNGLNISTKVQFFDSSDNEITSATLNYTQNFTYTIDKLDKWFSIPQGINKSNQAIIVPYNAKTCEITLTFGGIQTTFYIDNIIVVGY